MLRSVTVGCRESAVVLSIFRRGIDFEFEGSSVTIADYAASELFVPDRFYFLRALRVGRIISAMPIMVGF
jgi:hypothetical protein